MTAHRDPDRLITAFLEEGVNELPDRAYEAVRAATEQTRQRVVLGPWREEQMTRFAMFAAAAAVIVLAVVFGLRFLSGDGGIGVGGQPTPSPTPTSSPTSAAPPSPTPSVAPTASPTPPGPIVDPALGRLDAGTYVAHPFAPPNDGIAFTLTVPSDSWEAVDWLSEDGGMSGVAWSGNSGGVAAGFVRVDTLNEDPCTWSNGDDVSTGTSVDDLVTALTSTSEALVDDLRYDVSAPSEVSLGGYSGKQVVVTMPLLDYASQCDEGSYQIWNAEGFDIDAMDAENRWKLWIVDVEGERVVILMSDFEDSRPERVQELQSIVDSIVITAP